MEDIEDIDFGALGSATKYPSIYTYHALDPRDGSLLDEVTQFTGPVVLTEKVDGANGRIIIMPDGDWFLGSREEILYARGDRIENPTFSIVEKLKPLAQATFAEDTFGEEGFVQVLYLEVYGHRIGQAAKQYSTDGNIGYRLFDMARVPVEVLTWPRERIASWREHGGQQWATETDLLENTLDIPVTPRLRLMDGADLPTSLEDTLAFLQEVLPQTRASLDSTGLGVPEGIVLRSQDRSVIAKAKFRDYARTLKRRKT